MLAIFKSSGASNSNNTVYQFWQQNNHPIELWSPEVIQQKVNYIHNNPVVEGIVEKPEDYVFSSARGFAGKSGLVELEELYVWLSGADACMPAWLMPASGPSEHLRKRVDSKVVPNKKATYEVAFLLKQSGQSYGITTRAF